MYNSTLVELSGDIPKMSSYTFWIFICILRFVGHLLYLEFFLPLFTPLVFELYAQTKEILCFCHIHYDIFYIVLPKVTDKLYEIIDKTISEQFVDICHADMYNSNII